MRAVRRVQWALAAFQALSTALGCVEFVVIPHVFDPTLDGSAFAHRYIVAALLLGVVVGGWQWCAVVLHLRRSRWWAAAHALAGLVMLGWIAGECLVLDSFTWPHALWGGVGAVQLFLAAVSLGVFRPHPLQHPA